jgi:hypothetical protein
MSTRIEGPPAEEDRAMPMRLTVGVSKKVGLPDDSGVGARCSVEVERPEGLVDSDLEAFHERAHDAYVACHQAVFDELNRLAGPKAAAAPKAGAPGPDGRAGLTARPPRRPD